MTVDDYLPCAPMGALSFTTTKSGDYWVPILEKAYAKLHKTYHTLVNLSVASVLMDLTGCPTSNFLIADEIVTSL